MCRSLSRRKILIASNCIAIATSCSRSKKILIDCKSFNERKLLASRTREQNIFQLVSRAKTPLLRPDTTHPAAVIELLHAAMLLRGSKFGIIALRISACAM
jgi:hypothetical protein